MAQVDYFLKLDGIPGESRDAKHKDELLIESFSWGVSNVGSVGSGGGGGVGKAQFTDVTFVAPLSTASPRLFAATASGRHLKEGILTVRKAESGEFYKLRLTDILVSSYQVSGGEGEPPVDQFSLAFAKIEVSYTPQKADGSLGDPILEGWDLKANGKA